MIAKRVGLIGYDRVTALHLVGPADAFAAAALDDGYGQRIPCYDVSTIGIPRDTFQAECGLTFTADSGFETASDFDTVIIAGGSGIRSTSGIGAQVATWLIREASAIRRIGAVCSGIYGLAPTGWLDGREVTTHWRCARDVAQRFPRLKVDHRRLVVHDGPYYTSTGLSAGIHLALAMIQEDYGPHVAQSVERELILQPVAQDRASIPAGTEESDSHPRDRFADLVAWIVRNLQADLSVDVLARRACMCPSHFSKAFKSVFGEPPSDFVENLRLNEARRRLSKRGKTLRSVAASVGFTNSESFQRAFQRRFGARPSTYLEPFRRTPVASSPIP